MNEVDDKTQHLMMFKRLIDQNYKTSEDKISAMTALANLVLGPQDVKMFGEIFEFAAASTGAKTDYSRSNHTIKYRTRGKRQFLKI